MGEISGGLRFSPRGAFAHQGPTRHAQSKHERRGDAGDGPKGEFIPANQLLKLVEITRRTGDHRFIVQVVLDVRGQSAGCFVTPRAVLLQCLHDDPVQIALQLVNEFGSVRAAVPGDRFNVRLQHRGYARGRTRGFLFEDGPPHRVQPGRHQIIRVEWRLASEQFVKQHAQGIDVRPGVNVEGRHHGLFRAHVGWRAHELLKRGEDGLVGQSFAGSGFGDSKINDFGISR